MEREVWEAIFHPRAIAVVGASRNPTSFGHQFLCYLLEGGYRGKIYAVNPESSEILGVKSYPTLTAVPGNVDYAICCLNASRVIEFLKQCPLKRVRAVHLLTARLSETGRPEAKELEEEIARVAKSLGIRLIGPNCMGVYNPNEGIAFNYDLPRKSGNVGGIFQSGGIAGEFARHAGLRGVYFSKAVSYGNAVDLNECDFLEYFLADPETEVIVMYIEGTRDGPRLFKTLRAAASRKPVIALKGGRSKAGTSSAASHTASMAGAFSTWEVLFRQCKVIPAGDFGELLDLATCFALLPPFTGRKVGIIGGGGGKAVLAADEFEEAGFKVVPLPAEIEEFIRENDPRLASWVRNPVDFSILGDANFDRYLLFELMAKSPAFDFLVVNLTEDNPFGKDYWKFIIESQVACALAVAQRKAKPLAVTMNNPEIGPGQLESWRWQTLLAQREKLAAAGIPVFAGTKRAASALSKFVSYYEKMGGTR